MKLFMFLCISILSEVSMSVEEPPFSVEKKYDQYEIRNYKSILVAETMINSDFESSSQKAFRILAAFIFGNNLNKQKIEMTAPVIQKRNTIGYRVQFIMPSNYTIDTIPQPNDKAVKVIEIPSRRLAVYQYTGSWSVKNFEEKLKLFKSLFEKDNIKIQGEPLFARYNSPYQLWFLRKNEIWFEISIK